MHSARKQPNASAELMPDTSTAEHWSATALWMTAATPDLAIQRPLNHLLTDQNTPFGAALPGQADFR